MREYLILSRAEAASVWAERGVVEAHAPDLAIKRAKRDGVEGDIFAAVPTRNWTVARPRVKKQEPIIELEIIQGQLTVEDVIADAEKEGLVAAAPPAA